MTEQTEQEPIESSSSDPVSAAPIETPTAEGSSGDGDQMPAQSEDPYADRELYKLATYVSCSPCS